MADFHSDLLAVETKWRAQTTGNVVFYGSSSIRLWPRLERAFPENTVENWGFGGSTLAHCAYFFERFIAPRKPAKLVIYGGDNDLALGASPENVWESLRHIFELRDLLLGQVPTAILSIKPSPARTGILSQIETANEWLHREVSGREKAVWVEIFEAMLSQNGEPNPNFYTSDELHLSRAGYDVWNRVLRREFLGK